MLEAGVQSVLSKNKLWIIAYLATILLPLGLIFSRGLAESCVVIICLLFLLESFVNKKWIWLRDPVVIIGLISWVWLLFVTLFAKNSLESIGVSAPWIRYIFLYAALRNWVLINKKHIYFIGKSMAFILCFVMIDTLWQYIYGISLTGHARDISGRLTGPMDNVKVGIFIAKTVLPICGILLFFTEIKQKFRRIGIIIFFITTIVIVMLTGERTAFSSVMIAVFIVSFLFAFSEPRLRKIIFIGFVIVSLVMSFLIATQSWVQFRAHEFYLTVSNYPESNYGKLARAGFEIGIEHPLFGVGLKGFRESCPSLNIGGEDNYCNLHPHNPYMEWFAEAGVVGLLLFISLIFSIFYICVKAFRVNIDARRMLVGIVMANLLANFFPFMPTQSIFSNWPSILLWYSVSLAIASLNALSEPVDTKQLV